MEMEANTMGRQQTNNHGDWIFLELSNKSVREPVALVRFIEISAYDKIPLKTLENGVRTRAKGKLLETKEFLEKAAAKLPKGSDYRTSIDSDLEVVNWALVTYAFWTPEYSVALRREIK